MPNIIVGVVCQGCHGKTNVKTKRPDHFTAYTVAFECSGCGSKLQTRFCEDKNRERGRVGMNTRVVAASRMLVELLAEEAAERAEVEKANAAPTP